MCLSMELLAPLNQDHPDPLLLLLLWQLSSTLCRCIVCAASEILYTKRTINFHKTALATGCRQRNFATFDGTLVHNRPLPTLYTASTARSKPHSVI